MSRKSRLSPDDWIRAGLDALSTFGPEALKAEPLARTLETTKGSFYWHFPDVPAYRKALLDFWSTEAITALPSPEDRKAAVAQLHALVRDGFSTNAATESAMRSWALSDETARTTLADIDARRLAHLKEVLRQVGVTNPDIARMLYAAQVGMSQLDDAGSARNGAALDTLVDLVLALR